MREQVERWLGLETDIKLLVHEHKEIMQRRPEFRMNQYISDPEWRRYSAINTLIREKFEAQARIGLEIGASLSGKFLTLPDGRIMFSQQHYEDGSWELETREPL